MTKNNEVITEKLFQNSGVTRRLWTFGRLQLTIVVNTLFYFLNFYYILFYYLLIYYHYLPSVNMILNGLKI